MARSCVCTTVLIASFRLGAKPGKARMQKLPLDIKFQSAVTQHPAVRRRAMFSLVHRCSDTTATRT